MMENKETFWQVFLRSDNLPLLIVVALFIMAGLIIDHKDGGWAVWGIGLVVLALDAWFIYKGLNKSR